MPPASRKPAPRVRRALLRPTSGPRESVLPGSAVETREAEVVGTIGRVIFHRPESGYSVLRLDRSGGPPVTLVGTLPEPREGERLRARGTWRDDPAWGRQLVATSLEILPPGSPEALAAYLASGIVPGLGPKTAAKLVARFGEVLPEVLERSPERLAEVKGLPRGLAERLVAAWRSHRAGRDLLLFLHAHGVGLARARAVLEAWGEDAFERVTRDPYALAREVPGVGFRTADTLARRLGIEEAAPVRLVGALEEVLRRAAEDGHTTLDRPTLIEEARALLDGVAPDLELALDRAIAEGLLVATPEDGGSWIQLPELARAEEAIARELARLAAVPLGWRFADPEATLELALAKLGLEPAPGQRAALRAALSSKLLIVTGGPGTGKTTLVRAILAALEEPGLRVALAAPTGRAAKRLSESTGREARTLHRLLEAEPGRGFRRHRGRPLECDLLIVDEVSMVDTLLMRATLEALPDGAALLLVGDADQLPSVGPGQVLADLLESGRVPTVRLAEIFRQAAESGIVRNAHRIHRGELPEFSRGEDPAGDFFGIKASSGEEAAARIVELVVERIPERFGLDPWADIQVLSPVNRGPAGVRELNRLLQARLNPAPADAIERAGQRLGVGDKVMQLANDYEREVYNGDLGRITAIDRAGRTVEVVFDGRPLTYGFDELEALAPAFAATVHKAQGSEYPAVVLALCRAHGRMLTRRLLYTAVTRARRLVVLVAEPTALDRAVREGGGDTRRTLLRHRLAVLQERPTNDGKRGP
ncbi:MAG: ATP-dependent RecD-like DNA helicase [Geminicoccaceae bacterium]|nr:ATP-dependent RecD-like DNA helicase [Geminicoccaceae bacterium]